jgi:hypothetical protein
VLERFGIRLLLTGAIIASLLPIDVLERLEPAFFAVFVIEFTMRALALGAGWHPADREGLGIGVDARSVRPLHGRAGAIALLLLDAVAMVSFLPAVAGLEGPRWLRVLRLTRLLALVGYWAPIVRDLWGILLRRGRLRQVVLMGVVVAGLSFAGALVLHHAGTAVDATDDGVIDRDDASFENQLWWAFRQVQDPGNMLDEPLAVTVVLVSLALTVFGLFLVSFLIGLGTDVVHELLELSRIRPPGLRGHNVVVNITPSTRRLLHELMRYYRKLLPTDAPLFTLRWFRELRRRGLVTPRFVVVGNSDEPPEFLRQPALARIVYRRRSDDEEEFLERTDLVVAKRIVLLADQSESNPDAETIRTLLTVVERIRDREQRPDVQPLGRQRVVIAEVLDESNVAAAQAALATCATQFRGFAVPTEKLLGLFFAAILRRPGLGKLLDELLTSSGHEIYTCFFDVPSMGFRLGTTPRMGPTPRDVLHKLLVRGLEPGGTRRIVPIGLLTGKDGDDSAVEFDVAINPAADESVERYRGFVALADNFRTVADFAASLPERFDGPAAPAPEPIEPVPELVRTHRRKSERVLVCGFRPGSIYMLEEILRSDPAARVLVLVHDEDARRRMLEAFESHSQLVARGLLGERHGTFARAGEALHFHHGGGAHPTAALHLAVADWMASRHLVDLPCGFGHVAELDAIVLVADDPARSDARTAATVLKLDALLAGRQGRPRVLAEVFDDRLAGRLAARARQLGHHGTECFSIQELRAFFLFQSVVVPGFDLVYAELLGSWGQSFVHKQIVEGTGTGSCSFQALALDLWRRGEVLVAVELRTADGFDVRVVPTELDQGGSFSFADLHGVWVLAPEASTPAPVRVPAPKPPSSSDALAREGSLGYDREMMG